MITQAEALFSKYSIKYKQRLSTANNVLPSLIQIFWQMIMSKFSGKQNLIMF